MYVDLKHHFAAISIELRLHQVAKFGDFECLEVGILAWALANGDTAAVKASAERGQNERLRCKGKCGKRGHPKCFHR